MDTSKLTAEEAGRLYETGMNYQQIAEELSCTASMAKMLVLHSGVPLRTRPPARRLDAADLAKAIEMHRGGMAISNVALYFALNPQTVRRQFEEAGEEVRPAGTVVDESERITAEKRRREERKARAESAAQAMFSALTTALEAHAVSADGPHFGVVFDKRGDRRSLRITVEDDTVAEIDASITLY